MEEFLALLAQSIDAALEVDQQTAFVRYDEILLRRGDRSRLVQRLRREYIQIGQIRKVGQVGEKVFLQDGAVDAVDSLDAQRGVEYPVAGRHHDVAAILVPDLATRLHVYRSLALAQVDLVAAQQYHVFVPGRYVDASAVAVVRRSDTLAGAPVAIEQAVDVYAGYLAASAGALQRRVRVVEYTLERVRDVDAHAGRAVERAGQVAALVRDALRLLRVLLVDTVAGLVGRVGAVRQQDRRAVSAKVHVNLHARAGRFRQAPLPAATPFAVVGVDRAYRRAHHRHLADPRFKRSGARHVDRHG